MDDLVAQVPDLLALLGDGPAEPGVGLAEPGFLVGGLAGLGRLGCRICRGPFDEM